MILSERGGRLYALGMGRERERERRAGIGEGGRCASVLKRGLGSCWREDKTREGRGHGLGGEGGAWSFLPNRCLLKYLKEKRKET